MNGITTYNKNINNNKKNIYIYIFFLYDKVKKYITQIIA